MERWRPIEEAPDYAVSDEGRVKRIKADRLRRGEGKLLRTPLGDAGYPVCSLHVNGKQLHRRIHWLVGRAFLGPKPTPKHELRHLDGDRRNAAASNLAWGTSKENKADCVRHGTLRHGERSNFAKLTAENVGLIRKSADHYKSVASAFGISPNHVHRIRRGERWSHTPERSL
jgi:hypothetical protein